MRGREQGARRCGAEFRRQNSGDRSLEFGDWRLEPGVRIQESACLFTTGKRSESMFEIIASAS